MFFVRFGTVWVLFSYCVACWLSLWVVGGWGGVFGMH